MNYGYRDMDKELNILTGGRNESTYVLFFSQEVRAKREEPSGDLHRDDSARRQNACSARRLR